MMRKSLTDQHLHFAIYAGLLSALSGLVLFVKPEYVERFLGGENPLVVLNVAMIIFVWSFNYLLPRNAFRLIERQTSQQRWLEVASLAVAFGAIAIAVDAVHPFPQDMNIPWPVSLAFYPVIGFIVEIFMHVAPLAILLLGVRLVTGRPASNAAIILAIIAVALIEPAYQAVASLNADSSTSVAAFVAVHVFLIDLAGLWLFRRYDFMTMYVFRLAYYAIWHVAWGYFRLATLF
jgi:hypothetical protein